MNTDRIILDSFIRHHPADAARILERLQSEETALFVKGLSNHLAVSVFNHLERYTAVKCLEVLGAERSAAIVEKLPLHVVSVLLRRVEKELKEAILSRVTGEISNPLSSMLNYPRDSAGALADPLVLTLPADITVKEALQRLQKRPEKAIYYLYIIDRQQELVGVINMRELMLARPGDPLSAVMHTKVDRLSAELNFPAIVKHSGWQEYHALPVVDNANILLGAIRYETLRRIEAGSKRSRMPRQALAASAALGELYKIGFSGLIRSATMPLKDRSEKNKKVR